MIVVTVVGGLLALLPVSAGPLTVQPPIVQHFTQLTEPADIQPALGSGLTFDPQYNGILSTNQLERNIEQANQLQRTFNPQAEIAL